MQSLSGFDILLIIAVAVLVVILALTLLHKAQPDSSLSRAEDSIQKWVSHEEQSWHTGITEAEAAAAGFVKRAVPTIEDELLKLLTEAENRLTSTSGEDNDIAEAQAKIAAANEAKAFKAKLIADHIAKLQATLPPAAAA